MNVLNSIIFSLLIFAAFFILAYRNRHDTSERIGWILLGICASSFVLYLPMYGQQEGALQPIGMYVHSLFYGIKAISGGQEIEKIEGLMIESEQIKQAYVILNYLFWVIAPVLSSGLILSMVADFLDRIRYHFSPWRSWHVFSELNESSLYLAEQIRKKNRFARIVFCGTRKCGKVLISKANQIGAIKLYAPCEDLQMPRRFPKRKYQIYLISGDEDVNLCSAEQLICKHRENKKAKITLNAFAESGTGISVVEGMKKGNVKVRFVDITDLLCSNLLLQYPLYDIPKGKDISVMIVGCDKTGMRMLKTISWCGQIEGYSLKIRVYDKNANQIKDRFLAQCPELNTNNLISFVQVDAESADFEKAVMDEVKGSPDATYVVMAMGDDEKNILLADRLYRLFLYHNRFQWTPQILTRIRSSTKSATYNDQENDYLKERKIRPFGSMEELFSENTLFHSYLDQLAFGVHLCYSDNLPSQLKKREEAEKKETPEEKLRVILDKIRCLVYWGSSEYHKNLELLTYLRKVESEHDKFMNSEYNRESSLAAALHFYAKLHCVGILNGQTEKITDEMAAEFKSVVKNSEKLLKVEINEHNRWNHFTRSIGFCSASEKDLAHFYPRNKNELTKRHLCLVEWNDLDWASEAMNKLIRADKEANNKPFTADDEINYKKTDEKIIWHIPDIILLANRLDETKMDEKIYQ